jgi:hypothetical protein
MIGSNNIPNGNKDKFVKVRPLYNALQKNVIALYGAKYLH